VLERRDVKNVVKFMKTVAPRLPSYFEENVELGGVSGVFSLGCSTSIAFRPIDGYWAMQIRCFEDEEIVRRMDMNSAVGVPLDMVSIFCLGALTVFGAIHVEYEDGEIQPTYGAYLRQPEHSEQDWADFATNWKNCYRQVYWMGHGLLPHSPVNAFSIGPLRRSPASTAQDVARLWLSQFEESFPDFFNGDEAVP
jgi:hypothetical protein